MQLTATMLGVRRDKNEFECEMAGSLIGGPPDDDDLDYSPCIPGNESCEIRDPGTSTASEPFSNWVRKLKGSCSAEEREISKFQRTGNIRGVSLPVVWENAGRRGEDGEDAFHAEVPETESQGPEAFR